MANNENNNTRQRRSGIRLLSILDNIDRISSLYQRMLEVDEVHIEATKNAIIIINNIPYSFYYLMKRNFYFINKNDIKLNITFKIKVKDNTLFYNALITLMTGNSLCNFFKCRDVFCHNGRHFYEKPDDVKYVVETTNPEEIMTAIERKINDYNTCDVCVKIWDMNSIDKIENVDSFTYDTCDNCNMIIHLNNKIMKNKGECSICLKTMYSNTMTKTECHHNFHTICLERWIETKNNCPLCRTTFI